MAYPLREAFSRHQSTVPDFFHFEVSAIQGPDGEVGNQSESTTVSCPKLILTSRGKEQRVGGGVCPDSISPCLISYTTVMTSRDIARGL